MSPSHLRTFALPHFRTFALSRFRTFALLLRPLRFTVFCGLCVNFTPQVPAITTLNPTYGVKFFCVLCAYTFSAPSALPHFRTLALSRYLFLSHADIFEPDLNIIIYSPGFSVPATSILAAGACVPMPTFPPVETTML